MTAVDFTFAAGVAAGIVWSLVAAIIGVLGAAALADRELRADHDGWGSSANDAPAPGNDSLESPRAERNGTDG